MPNHRRVFVPGGSWFFTVNLLDRRQALLVDHIEILREAVAATRRSYTFEIDAFVVLPIICMQSGACRRMIPISRHAGG